ncbi:MAG: glycosyltransferase family 39 protein, partial [Terriglobia bacterium]
MRESLTGERRFLAFLSGAAIVSTLVFILAAVHLIYPWILGGLGLLILAAWYRFARRPLLRSEPEPNPLSTAWRLLFWCPFIVYSALYLLSAMMPEMSPDGIGYHVGLVTRYYEHRGFFPLTTQMYAGLSGGIEMLFLVAFAFGRHSAAAMVHLLFLLALPFGILAYARRMGAPRAGVIAALLVFIAPVVGRDGTCAYVDVATGVVVFGAFYSLEIWRADNDRRFLPLAGLLAGFAYAAKFTAAMIVLYGLIYVVAVCRSRRVRWGSIAANVTVFATLVCLMAGPWILKDFIQFHNPFFPFFNSWFPNPYQYPLAEAQWREYFTHMNGITLAHIPYQVTVGGRLDG